MKNDSKHLEMRWWLIFYVEGENKPNESIPRLHWSQGTIIKYVINCDVFVNYVISIFFNFLVFFPSHEGDE